LDRVADVVRYLVLARLLVPEQLGVFGVVSVVCVGVQALTFTGFRFALIRRPTDPTELYDTAFLVEMARGILLAAAMCAAAPCVADFFDAPVTRLLQVESLALVLVGAVNIGTIEFQRNLDFRMFFLTTRTPRIVSLVVGLTLTAVWRDVWALVVADVCQYAAMVLLSYRLHPYRPRLRFRFDHAREMFSFGGWMTVNSIGLFLLQQFDSLVVARRFGPGVLAPYQIAYRLAMFPVNSLREVIQSVTFPVFSRISDDRARIASGYSQVFTALSAVVAPAAILTACLAEDFVYLALGANWMAAAPIIRILAFFCLVQIVVFTMEPVFQALGEPRLTTISRYCHIAAVVPLVWTLAGRYGPVGAAWGATLAGLAPLAVLSSLFFRRFPGAAAPLARNLAGLLPALAALAAAAIGVRHFAPELRLEAQVLSAEWLRTAGWTAASAASAAAAYLSALYVAERTLSIGVAQVLRQVRSGIRSSPPAPSDVEG
jgi:O-antigen/teichoic acid export membrane protein